MMLPEVIDKLRHLVLSIRDVRYTDAQLQAEHNRLVGQHYELIRTLSLMLRNPDLYPLAVAIDIAGEIDDPTAELAKLLSAHNIDLWRGGPVRDHSRLQRRSGCC
jgi:hypothetical protein